MNNLYTWMIVSIGLSAIGFIVSFSEGMKQRRRVLDSLPKDTSESILEDESSPREKLSGMTFIYVMLSLPSLIYTIFIVMLIVRFSPLTAVQERVAAGAVLAVGISSMFANFGRALFYKEAMDGLNEWDEGSPEFYGPYTVFLVITEPASIYGINNAMLGLIFSGVLGGSSGHVTMPAADSYFTGSMILGISAVATIVMGAAFRKTKPLYEDIEYFGKKMLFTVIPHFINIIGLGIAIFMMVFSGMTGA